MRESGIRTRFARGETVLNAWLGIPSAVSAEIMATQGFDAVTVDMQHGLVDYQAAVTMLQAISTTSATPMCRVPWLDATHLMKILDAGAYGVICPMINTGEEAERLVSYCRYPPRGGRSFGPMRALIYGGPDYQRHANETLLVIAMIETREAMDNMDDIMKTPGLDGVYVGPSDLALSLGHAPAGEPDEPEVVEAVKEILARAKQHGLYAGMHCATGEHARRVFDMGFNFASVANDGRILAAAAKAVVEAAGQPAAEKAAPEQKGTTGVY